LREVDKTFEPFGERVKAFAPADKVVAPCASGTTQRDLLGVGEHLEAEEDATAICLIGGVLTFPILKASCCNIGKSFSIGDVLTLKALFCNIGAEEGVSANEVVALCACGTTQPGLLGVGKHFDAKESASATFSRGDVLSFPLLKAPCCNIGMSLSAMVDAPGCDVGFTGSSGCIKDGLVELKATGAEPPLGF
jgi:hypothetical protein